MRLLRFLGFAKNTYRRFAASGRVAERLYNDVGMAYIQTAHMHKQEALEVRLAYKKREQQASEKPRRW